MTKIIPFKLKFLPNEFKQHSAFYQSVKNKNLDNVKINILSDFCHFSGVVNEYNDIEKVLSTYKFWKMPSKMFFIFVNKHKNIIDAHIKEFIYFITNLEIGKSLLHFLYTDTNELCKYIFYSGDVFLVDFFFNTD